MFRWLANWWRAKQLQRALHTRCIDDVSTEITDDESSGDGLWCLVGGEVSFVPIHGGRTVTDWEDPLDRMEYELWLVTHSKRVHDTHESAVAFVRSRLCPRRQAEPEPEADGGRDSGSS